MSSATARAHRGQSGEAHARAWLEGQGYRHVESNWRCPGGELDLIMVDGDELVFVEVKTRSGERFGRAAESITSGKARRVIGAAEQFIASCSSWQEMIWRCDIVGVTIDLRTGSAHIDHVKNALIVG